jgi:hypothetical protein
LFQIKEAREESGGVPLDLKPVIATKYPELLLLLQKLNKKY